MDLLKLASDNVSFGKVSLKAFNGVRFKSSDKKINEMAVDSASQKNEKQSPLFFINDIQQGSLLEQIGGKH
jgi:hypothetical protein